MSLQCWAYTPALQREKSISPLFPAPRTGALAVNKGEIQSQDCHSLSISKFPDFSLTLNFFSKPFLKANNSHLHDKITSIDNF